METNKMERIKDFEKSRESHYQKVTQDDRKYLIDRHLERERRKKEKLQ